MKQLEYKGFHARYAVPIYLWRMKHVLNFLKLQNSMKKILFCNIELREFVKTYYLKLFEYSVTKIN